MAGKRSDPHARNHILRMLRQEGPIEAPDWEGLKYALRFDASIPLWKVKVAVGSLYWKRKQIMIYRPVVSDELGSFRGFKLTLV